MFLSNSCPMVTSSSRRAAIFFRVASSLSTPERRKSRSVLSTAYRVFASALLRWSELSALYTARFRPRSLRNLFDVRVFSSATARTVESGWTDSIRFASYEALSAWRSASLYGSSVFSIVRGPLTWSRRSRAACAVLISPSARARNPAASGRPVQKGGATGVAEAAGVAASAANRAAGATLVSASAKDAEMTIGGEASLQNGNKRTNPPHETGLELTKRWGALSAAMLPQR